MKNSEKMKAGAIFRGKNASVNECDFYGPDAGFIDEGSDNKFNKSKAFVTKGLPSKPWYKKPEIIIPIIIGVISIPWLPRLFSYIKGN